MNDEKSPETVREEWLADKQARYTALGDVLENRATFHTNGKIGMWNIMHNRRAQADAARDIALVQHQNLVAGFSQQRDEVCAEAERLRQTKIAALTTQQNRAAMAKARAESEEAVADADSMLASIPERMAEALREYIDTCAAAHKRFHDNVLGLNPENIEADWAQRHRDITDGYLTGMEELQRNWLEAAALYEWERHCIDVEAPPDLLDAGPQEASDLQLYDLYVNEWTDYWQVPSVAHGFDGTIYIQSISLNRASDLNAPEWCRQIQVRRRWGMLGGLVGEIQVFGHPDAKLTPQEWAQVWAGELTLGEKVPTFKANLGFTPTIDYALTGDDTPTFRPRVCGSVEAQNLCVAHVAELPLDKLMRIVPHLEDGEDDGEDEAETEAES